MTAIKPIKCGWKWLEGAINALIDAINARTISVPVGGGIDILETTSGTKIALTSSHLLSKGSGTGPDGGAWLTIDVMDSSCNRSTIQVWAKTS